MPRDLGNPTVASPPSQGLAIDRQATRHRVPSAPMEIRLARPDDAEAIRAIYNHEVRTSTATMDIVERSVAAHEAWMADRSGAFSVLVATEDDGVTGFASLSPFRERAAYRSTVEDSVYIAEGHRGRGVADGLLGDLLEVARTSGFHSVIARIGGDNEASIALHVKHGFTEVGVERQVGRKFNRWVDVTVMQIVLDD
jgi:phosphinothricin acetyltransferase